MTTTTILESTPRAHPLQPIPKLRHGERLSRVEFERRYANMPDVKAELLDGVVHMSSPVSVDHGSPHTDLDCWLATYKAHTPGTQAGNNVTNRLSDNSVPQPDAFLRILESHGGNSFIDADRYVAGAPELLGEVANSSKGYDLNVKMPIYKRDGIREFILWRVEDNAIDWFVLRDDNFEPLTADASGIIRSETFPGLWLDALAMLRGDLAQVLSVLQQGIASHDHAEFVERLRKNAKKK